MDEFKCHPNHVNKMRKHYNQILFELYHSNLMSQIVKEISGKDVYLLPPNPDGALQILEGNYGIN